MPYKLTPIDYAIWTIESTITELLRQKAALEALQPERKLSKKIAKLVDPRILRGEKKQRGRK